MRLVLAVATLWLCACEQPEREPFSFYDERIGPILDSGCQRQTTGCHVDSGDGFALGNLDLSSFDSLMRRPDVLVPYGPYSVGVLLLKAGDPIQVRVETLDPPDPSNPDRHWVTVETDVRHGGGEGAIAQGSRDYAALKQWIDGGHTRNGVPEERFRFNTGSCVNGAGSLPGVDLSVDPPDGRSYDAFVDEVQPVLQEYCAGSSCHGSKLADLYLTCGDDDRDLRWNYYVALQHVSDVAATSELLRRPLAMQRGGVYHEGDAIFADTDAPAYRTLLRWAEDIADRAPELTRWQTDDEGLRFFANRVQPVLVKKGCMFLNCHSPSMFHDLRLRGGSQGDFAEIATRRNYEMSRLMLALESDDPNASRLIAKNLCPAGSGGVGVAHRGGALLEDFGGCALPERQASADKCDGVDADAGDLDEIPAYCVLARWQALERELAIADGHADAGPAPSSVVWVSRPQDVGSPLDFDTFRGGADLVSASASVDADGQLSLGAPTSLLGGCADLTGDVDVRGPAVSWDASEVAFAARTSADAPLRLYRVAPDGSGCEPIAGAAPNADSEGGILLHDFDPAYAPDGRLVFASTRGYLTGGGGYRGPTRTPAALAPNANLYVYEPDEDTPVRQLTFLLNQEVGPSFMTDGRIIFTAEKRALDFHQLAGRRLNLDGGDYHPLFAQRPSVGFEAATEIVELLNRDLAMVAAPLTATDGGGTIVVVNRSIGPDQDDRDPDDQAYIHSSTMPSDGAFGGGSGVFRSPAPLPSGRLLASCDLDAADLERGAKAWGLCEIDPAGRAQPREVFRDPSRVAVEAVAVFRRPERQVFASRSDEANGSTRVVKGESDAQIHYLDLPLLGTLLFSNTRIGRPLSHDVGGFEVFEPRPPPMDADSFDDLGSAVVDDRFGRYYEELVSHGVARTMADGSLRVMVPGGTPLSLALIDADGRALSFPEDGIFEGPMRQREAVQFYPGERVKQSVPRRLFNGMCGGCHGSITGRELDIVVNVDVLSGASRTLASDDLQDLR